MAKSKKTNLSEYKNLPAKLIGMRLDQAKMVLKATNGPWSISKMDGVARTTTMQVQILLEVENDIVVATELDGQRWSKKNVR